MADDPYKTLGVTKEASQEDIQKAFAAELRVVRRERDG